MSEWSEAEAQVLVALAVLEEKGERAEPSAVAALGRDYFGMYLLDWSSAFGSLVAQGQLRWEGAQWRLTTQGKPLAKQQRAEKPKHLYFYNEYYTRTLHSQAHARFCELVYGKDLCQHGLADMAQLGRLLDVLALGAQSRVLELGCGNGMVTEYIADRTGAQVTGVDSSRVGIEQAQQRTADRRQRLAFICADMLRLDFPPASFDTVLAIDSLYFVSDLNGLLDRLRVVVRPQGQMAAFYSSWIDDGGEPERLLPEGNPFAQALHHRGWKYQVWDLTPQEIAHWRLKLKMAEGMQREFEQEGNEFVFRNRYLEAKNHNVHVEASRVRRYLYRVAL